MRNQKNLYSEVKSGSAQDVVGMDLKLELPKHPDFHVVNDGQKSVKETLGEILGQ